MDILKSKHDSYCWKCCDQVDLSNDTENKQCTNCVRTFHDGCLVPSEHQIYIESDQWLCSICTEITAAEQNEKPTDLDLLSVVMKQVSDNKIFNVLKQPFKCVKFLVNPINLKTIQDKVECVPSAYRSLIEFRADFQHIVHNCTITYTDYNTKTRTARLLLEYVNDEIEGLRNVREKCIECYEHVANGEKNWFTLPCTKPHLLLWAKFKGYNFWPAKLMSANNKMVNVRFFGDYTYNDLPAFNCYLYSEKNPDGPIKGNDLYVNLYNRAVNEANEYMDNIRTRFGRLELAKGKTMLNPEMVDAYLSDMMPTIGRQSLRNASRDHDYYFDTSQSDWTDTQSDNQTSNIDMVTIQIEEVIENYGQPSAKSFYYVQNNIENGESSLTVEKIHDRYCWRCAECRTRLHCRNCIRSFHKKCVENDVTILDKEKIGDWLCPVCTVLNATEVSHQNMEIWLKFIERIWRDKSFDPLKCPLADPEIKHIIHPIDLMIVKNKAVSYSSFNEFYVDISWIVHNCMILYPENHEKTVAARSLLKLISQEIHSQFTSYQNTQTDEIDYVSCSSTIIKEEKIEYENHTTWKKDDYEPGIDLKLDGFKVEKRRFSENIYDDNVIVI